ncbi:helix-turn-helix domain-containing protein [Paeniclostridium sordellii]|uniref:helix-turn-helix domain-containing protein n=1 Tax=Clostridia TaxID=186801 RepID=UPI0013604382|nr:helix-turn-helix transcriptional regulator [Clostridium sp.]MDU4415438.1 helix-turn-helix transcriptional regulator [Paeniclostridium sordellii]MTN08147.1 helix-turn-helix domain-containing protein [Turicibacter sanguinis]MDU4480004.1 helix-turn-helix transcriptional regulator [Clostridium sp.]MRZ29758.1 helix-turn-helix domain-containing protein [Paeniclostridium sordellii]MTN35320.1 helix-turn-helix domain-containing protein [Turicibacter sanguinis]
MDKKKGWSQDDLAKQLNISRQAISKWETGESQPDVDKLLVMSEIFDITLDELIKGEIQIKENKTGITMSDFLYELLPVLKENLIDILAFTVMGLSVLMSIFSIST